MKTTTIQVPKDAVWCGLGFYIRLSDETVPKTLRLVDGGPFDGLWVAEEDYDRIRLGHAPYSAFTPTEYQADFWGVAGKELAPLSDGRRAFRLDDGRVVAKSGFVSENAIWGIAK